MLDIKNQVKTAKEFPKRITVNVVGTKEFDIKEKNYKLRR